MTEKRTGSSKGELFRIREWADSHPVLAYWLPVVVYSSGIFILSSMSIPPTPPGAKGINYFSEIIHFIEYAGLAVLLYLAFNSSWREVLKKRAELFAGSIACIYAATDEYHQSFVPGRSATVEDFLVDCIGAVLIIFVAKYIKYSINHR